MFPPLLLHRKVADSSIMPDCNHLAYGMFRDAMPKMFDAHSTCIFRKWQRAGHLLFYAIMPTYIFALEGCDDAAY
jgi:hypothetical protein